MQSRSVDWSIIRGSMILFVVCAVLAGGMLFGSNYFRDQMKNEFKLDDRRFKDISRRYLSIDQEEKLIREYYPVFIEYYRDGLLGKEKRLNWLESLRNASDLIKIPDLRYQIDSQEPFVPEYGLSTGVFQLYRSKMALSMALLHEGDLFALLKRLDRNALGQYSVNNCRLKRNRTVIDVSKLEKNVTAECDLEWYTLDLAGENELKL